jgi:hypothetical protein
MRAVSSRWATAIAQAHQLSIAVVVIEPDGTETHLTPEDGDDGNGLIDASVTLDANASVRGRASLTVVNQSLIPQQAEDLLAPYANEVRIERGFTTPEGYTERVVVMTGRIEDSDVSGGPGDLVISLNALDRAQRMIDAKFETAGSIAAGTAFETAITNLLTEAWPDIPTDFTATGHTTPLLVWAEEEDRWEACQMMAQSLGMDLYFDGDGTCILRPYAPGSAVADLVEGDGGLLLEAGRSWTRQGAFNKVIATGENADTGAIYRGEAYDDEATSPTNYDGPFGRVPRFYQSPYIVSDDQAQDAANTILAKELGTTQQVNFGSIVNAALEPHDVVRVKRTDLGLDTSLIVESLQIPLSADGVMTGVCKATTVT